MPRKPRAKKLRSRVGDELFRATLALAAQIGSVLWETYQRRTAVIGGYALGLHGHVRTTGDLDLAIVTDHMDLMQRALERAGLSVTYSPPDAEDPLGGVLRVTAEGCLPVEVVNFGAERRGLRQSIGLAAVDTAQPMPPVCSVPVVRLPQLVALKLYAGDEKDLRDAKRLLRGRTPDELLEVRRVCEALGLGDNLGDVLAPTVR